jgi:predicted HicB family RNase H-like nuclease
MEKKEKAPKKTEMVCFRSTERLSTDLKEQAEKDGLSRNELIETVLARFLKRRKEADAKR